MNNNYKKPAIANHNDAGFESFWTTKWRARQESNLYQKLRKLLFYPLNYRRQADDCTLHSAFVQKRNYHVFRSKKQGVNTLFLVPIYVAIIGRLHDMAARFSGEIASISLEQGDS